MLKEQKYIKLKAKINDSFTMATAYYEKIIESKGTTNLEQIRDIRLTSELTQAYKHYCAAHKRTIKFLDGLIDLYKSAHAHKSTDSNTKLMLTKIENLLTTHIKAMDLRTVTLKRLLKFLA